MASLTQQLLKDRGIKTKKKAEIFLHPDYERDLHDPFLFSGMKKAVKRILHAIDGGEQIVIYGDYDCDGIPGATLLYEFFKKIDYEKVAVRIPHRYTDGYGLSVEAVRKMQKENASLIITVDCGITDCEAVAGANEFGIDVIITDHHIVPKRLPKAFAIVDAFRRGDKYPNKNICGAGVAFKLVQALITERDFGLHKGWEKWLLDLAGLATIADVVPLIGENRALAYYGLKVLRKTQRVGLLELFKKKNIRPENITEEDVGFTIGPHINAASRMGDPYDAFRLLATNDYDEAKGLVKKLLVHNTDRKSEVQVVIREVEALMHLHTELPLIIVGRADWKPGIVGLAANMIAEKYKKPAFVWGRANSAHFKGSCRSDGLINIVDLMAEVRVVSQDIFLDFGGHELAGGFSVREEKIELFAPALLAAHERMVKNTKEKVKNEKKKERSCPLNIEEIDWKLWGELEQFAPFGVGNERPFFSFNGVTVKERKVFGQDGIHTELVLAKKKGDISVIKFFAYDELAPLVPGTKINLRATLEKNTFKYPHNLRLRLVEWQPT